MIWLVSPLLPTCVFKPCPALWSFSDCLCNPCVQALSCPLSVCLPCLTFPWFGAWFFFPESHLLCFPDHQVQCLNHFLTFRLKSCFYGLCGFLSHYTSINLHFVLVNFWKCCLYLWLQLSNSYDMIPIMTEISSSITTDKFLQFTNGSHRKVSYIWTVNQPNMSEADSYIVSTFCSTAG